MADQIKVMGMVISSAPIGEHDKRIVLLTKEKGKMLLPEAQEDRAIILWQPARVLRSEVSI